MKLSTWLYFFICLIVFLHANPIQPMVGKFRNKRYYIVTEHAEQVKKAVERYRAEKERQRSKREWWVTMSPLQVQERYQLHSMTIKRRNH